MNIVERSVNGLMGWVNERAPGLMPAYKKHMSEYYAPKNFNFWYYFGSLAMLILVNQIVTNSNSTIDKATTCRAKKRFKVASAIR